MNSFKSLKTEPHDYKVNPLDTQYRSIPALGRLFSEYSYDGLLKHHRDSDSQTKVKIEGLTLKPINYYFFDVNKYEGCFAVKKLATSNVHVYSVIYVLEYCNYLAKHLEIEDNKTFKIGIICPYTAQAQLIENLINQVVILPLNIEIHVGTIHCFQGDQCNMIITVFNPPKKADDTTFKSLINKKNIINVAVSRAEDYLCIFMPHPDTYIFNQLHELKTLTYIANQSPDDISMNTCNDLEAIICGESNYIANNTFVTSHQLANVYTKPDFHYEVRIDEKAADIQINKDWI